MVKIIEGDRVKNKPGVEVTQRILIECLSNGDMNINGPIDNLMVFRDIMNAAERVVLRRLDERIRQVTDEASRIVVPEFIGPRMVGRN